MPHREAHRLCSSPPLGNLSSPAARGADGLRACPIGRCLDAVGEEGRYGAAGAFQIR